MRHLRYCFYSADDCNEKRHPQKVMESLGITYKGMTPQTIGDQLWYWGCENVPEELPEYLSDLHVDPLDWIGCGVSQDLAGQVIKEKSKATGQGMILSVSNEVPSTFDKEGFEALEFESVENIENFPDGVINALDSCEIDKKCDDHG